MDSLELGRRIKRNYDSFFSYKRITIIFLIVILLLMYSAPNVLKLFTFKGSTLDVNDEIDRCLKDRLTSFYSESDEYNVNIRHVPTRENENPFLIYVGNGHFGIDIDYDKSFYIWNGRGVTLSTKIFPLVYLDNYYLTRYKEAYVTNYLTGIVHVFQCYQGGIYASYQYYAHRAHPSIFVQEIKVSNPTDLNFEVSIKNNKIDSWSPNLSQTINVIQGNHKVPYKVVSGFINYTNTENEISAAVVHRQYPISMEVGARSTKTLQILTSIYTIHSTRSSKPHLSNKLEAEKAAIDAIKRAASTDSNILKSSHANVWQKLWSSGLTIGHSKAKDALNGDKINATMYYVLSQVKSHLKTGYSAEVDESIQVSDAEGCFGSYHTLESKNLWGDLVTIEEVNKIVSIWLLTLEKEECRKLLQAGAAGVVQAMVLSFGGLRFSDHHLEFNIHPRYLHRDYLFRRISYGNVTHLNISVVLNEDNKAVLYVALDRSDNNYYACDGGCLDVPVLLSQEKKQFPVKLTNPLYPILYITYDKRHIEDLRHSIHASEIVEAPAHEHHVIALHKHGHHLGGLPTFFWIAVSLLIFFFHLFLFKLIYNEYCSSSAQDKHRFRYGKL